MSRRDTRMKAIFWQLVHRWLPCKAVHALCSLCREEDLCPKCIERKFTEWGGHALPPDECPCTSPWLSTTMGSGTQTFSTGQTYTRLYWRGC